MSIQNTGSRFFLCKPLTTLLVSGCLILTACGGRAARPIAITNPTDSVMDCAGINREFQANERQITATIKERSQAQGKNIVLGAASVVFFPTLFFMDPKSPERVEIDALRNRNGVLIDMAKTKNCPIPQSTLKAVYEQFDNPSRAQQQKSQGQN